VRDHIRAMTDQFDCWLRSVGEEVKSNSGHHVDMKVFTDQYACAVDGWATYELEQQAQLLREDLAEAV
jgi:hypothetical protein